MSHQCVNNDGAPVSDKVVDDAELETAGDSSPKSSNDTFSEEEVLNTNLCTVAPALQPLMQSLYADLVGIAEAPILFSWMPKSQGWQRAELVERTSRCLPAVRPGKDLVALPKLQETQNLWCCWASEHALAPWQVVWFEPHLDDRSHGCGNPPIEALDEVLQSLPLIPEPTEPLCLYPMYLTPELEKVALSFGIRVVGDRSDHSFGPLPCAKAWLHPHINPQKRGSSLRDLQQVCGTGARGPMGYIASSVEELCQALHALQAETLVGTRFILKPSWASAGAGIILDVTETDLKNFDFPLDEACTAILEELIETDASFGDSSSPTLYMLGGKPCGAPADQLLREGGIVNVGNRWPSQLPDSIAQTCAAFAMDIHCSWGLKSQWGLDFVLDRTGTPIVVDLNMGRPNGNFAVRLWESRFARRLFLHSASWTVPEGLQAEELFTRLRLANLSWDQEFLSGVIIYQHLPGMESSYVVASASGWETVDCLLVKLEEIFQSYRD